MITVLLQSLALASVAVLSPGSITIVILLLMSGRGLNNGHGRGLHNGVAFVSGYLVMYSLIGVGVLVLGVNSAETATTEQSLITSLILIGIGIILLAVAVRNWRKPPPETQTDQPSRFAKLVDGITPLKAFGFACLAAIFNFKNLTIFLSAVSVLWLSDLALATQLVMVIPLVFVFCASVLIPIAIYLLFPDRASDYLNRIKAAISRYSRPLGIAVLLILGCLLLYRGLMGI